MSPAASRSSAQTSEQPSQAFSDSLLAASKSFLQDRNTNDDISKAGRNQKRASDNAIAHDEANGSDAILSPIASQQTQGISATANLPQVSINVPIAGDEASLGQAGQFMRSLAAVGLAGTQSDINQTSITQATVPQPAAVQSSLTSTQIPLGKKAATQATLGSVVISLSRNILSARSARTQSRIPLASIVSTNIVMPSAIQSIVVPAQMPVIGPATTQNDWTVVTDQSSQTVPTAGWKDAEPSIATTNILQTGISNSDIVEPQVTPAQSSLAESRTSQNISAGVIFPITRNLPLVGLTAIQSSIFTSIAVPAAVQSNAAQMDMSLAPAATTQSLSTFESSQATRNDSSVVFTDNQSIVAQATIVPTTIAQRTVASSSVSGNQMPLTAQRATQDTSTVLASQPTQTVPAEGWKEPESSLTPVSIPQPAAIQSNFTAAQIPFASQAAFQSDPNSVTSKSAQDLRTTELVEAQTSVFPANDSQSSAAQQPTIEPTGNRPSITTLSNDPTQGSSKLHAAQSQETTAPITSSPKSGNDKKSAFVTTVQDAVANAPAEPNTIPVLRAAVAESAKDLGAPALQTASAAQANPQQAASDQSSVAKTISVSNGFVDQLASLPLFDGSLGAIQTIVSSLKPVSAAKLKGNAFAAGNNSGTEQTGAKKNSELASEAGPGTSSQDAASSGNQSQSGDTHQAQNVAPIPVNIAAHSAATTAPAQNTATVAPTHTASTPAAAGGVAANSTNNLAAHASTALPQAPPVINTAKLIQSMGQSQIRVGMRSTEFGNISISTSTTRNLVSAQISLEHGELARTLVAHLPEMQARLGGNQPMDVRIDMNGAAMGQGTGSFGGMSNDTAGQSRGGRQQAGSIPQSQSGNGVAEQKFSPAVAALPTGYARLDIRV